MVETDLREVFLRNVGALVVHLASNGVFVKMGIEHTILSGEVLTIMISKVTRGETKSLKEVISESTLVQVPDASILAAAMIEKLLKS